MITIKRKKIRYIPGMISLIFIPIIFYFFGEHHLKILNQTATKLFIWDPKLILKYPEIFGGEYPPKRNYDNIYLTGDNKGDKIKLDFSQVRVREILKQNDSINGVHYHFGDSSEYWTFIKAINIFKIEEARSYMIYENNIWFMHYPPATTFVCGGVDLIDVPPLKKSLLAKSLDWIKPFWDSSWQLITGFTILLIFLLKNLFRKDKLLYK